MSKQPHFKWRTLFQMFALTQVILSTAHYCPKHEIGEKKLVGNSVLNCKQSNIKDKWQLQPNSINILLRLLPLYIIKTVSKFDEFKILEHGIELFCEIDYIPIYVNGNVAEWKEKYITKASASAFENLILFLEAPEVILTEMRLHKNVSNSISEDMPTQILNSRCTNNCFQFWNLKICWPTQILSNRYCFTYHCTGHGN